MPSLQTSTELQFCPPDEENTLDLASTHPKLLHRSQLLTLRRTVCLHSHIKVHTALINFPICLQDGSREDQGAVGLPITSDGPFHPVVIEQLHTPPTH